MFSADRVQKIYYSPSAFPGQLKQALKRQQQEVKETLAVIDKALAEFDGGMENQYELEKSLRWRAWYDLTVGRLLAMKVRHGEYLACCQSLLQGVANRTFKSTTNHIVCIPGEKLRTGEKGEKLAKEARYLLNRCLESNPKTPWAYLSQRELDYPFGIAVEQSSLARPRPQAGRPIAPTGGTGPKIPKL